MEKKRPNIIIFNPDQFRADSLGHLGNPAAVTPNLDKICEEDGVSFRNAFCQNPVCTPSRCSFMSGWYPHVRGHRIMYYLMHVGEPVLLRSLKEAGYYVWWAGKNDLIADKDKMDLYCDVRISKQLNIQPTNVKVDQSWRGEMGGENFYSFFKGKIENEYDGPEGGSDWTIIRKAVDFIHEGSKDKPFCMFLSLTYPHPHYAVEDPWYSQIDRNKVPDRIPAPENWDKKPSMVKGLYERQNLSAKTEEQWTELKATYYGMCSRIDYQFGLLVDALKKEGVYDDTAIFVFSDHGDFTGDYGLVEKTQNTFEDCLTNVPFIVKPPSEVEVKPHVSDALVELIDFPATVEELVSIEPAHTHFGKSVLPILKGEKDEHRDAVFAEGGRLQGEEHCMEKESKGNKGPEMIYWPRMSLQGSKGPEHTKATMVRTKEYKYVMRLYESDELYDLQKDPMELDNRIDDPTMKDALSQMKERLLKFYMETCDVVPHTMDKR
ncbi:MAG: sulfatase-like hydrolase/transferase [Firmicutes bacterium]|nr:sulfatase-like hydrolase/transferase [Bacillota bacterium]